MIHSEPARLIVKSGPHEPRMRKEEAEDVALGFDMEKKKRSVLRRSPRKLVNKILGWKETTSY